MLFVLVLHACTSVSPHPTPRFEWPSVRVSLTFFLHWLCGMLCPLFSLPPRRVMSEFACCLHCKRSVAAWAPGPLHIMVFALYACLVFSPLHMLDIAIKLGPLQPLLLWASPPLIKTLGRRSSDSYERYIQYPVLFFLGFPVSCWVTHLTQQTIFAGVVSSMDRWDR